MLRTWVVDLAANRLTCGEILPGAADAGHHGMATQASLGAHFHAPPAVTSAANRAQLLDHGVSGYP